MSTINDAIETIQLATKTILKQNQQIKDLEELLEAASEKERLAFYWGQHSEYYEFDDYKNSTDYLKYKP